MTAPALYHGNNSRIYANGYKLHRFAKSASIKKGADAPENTTIETPSRYITREADGLENGEYSQDGVHSDGTGSIRAILKAALDSETDAQIVVMPFGDTAYGTIGYAAKIQSSSLSINGEVKGVTAYSYGAKCDGPFQLVKSIFPMATVSADGTGTIVDLGAASNYGGRIYLQCVTATAITGHVVTVNTSANADMSSPDLIATFNTFAAAPAYQAIDIAVATNSFKRYIQVGHNITGTSVVVGVYAHQATRV